MYSELISNRAANKKLKKIEKEKRVIKAREKIELEKRTLEFNKKNDPNNYLSSQKFYEFCKINYSKESPFYELPSDLLSIILFHLLDDIDLGDYDTINNILRKDDLLWFKHIYIIHNHIINDRIHIICSRAILYDSVNCLKYLHGAENITVDVYSALYIIDNNNIPLLKYFLDNKIINKHDEIKYHIYVLITKRATFHGNLDIIKYMHSTYGMICNDINMYKAVEYNKLDIVKYLHTEMNVPGNLNALKIGISYGRFECVKYLFEIKTEYTSDLIDYAICLRKTDILEYLHIKMNLRYTNNSVKRAIKSNRINILKYLVDKMGAPVIYEHLAYTVNQKIIEYLENKLDQTNIILKYE